MVALRVVSLALLLSAVASAQVDPKTALLERAAWEALNAGRAHAAAEAFQQALDADPKNGRLHLGAALAAFAERRDADARNEAERAIDIDATLVQAREVLGQVLHRMGDLDGAIRAFEALTADKPTATDAAATLERWRREAELRDRMQEAIGSHFTVAFEGPEEADVADNALASLDRAYWRVGGVLGTFPTAPIPVILYTTQQFSDITRSPTWAAGMYDGVIRVPMRGAVEQATDLDRVLAHEFTHALVRSLAPRNVPTWLNEGLATALETGEPSRAERELGDAHAAVSLAQLQTSFGRLSGNEAQAAYATSAFAVRRLIDEAGGFAVANLLRDLGEGVDFNTAFLHRFQRSFADFQSAALGHSRN